MFRQRFDDHILVSEIADGFFPNINYELMSGDRSIVATTRYILADKLKEDESFTVRVYDRYPIYEDFDGHIATMFDGADNDTLCIHPVSTPDEKREEFYSHLDKATEKYPGYEAAEDMNSFCGKANVTARIFINTEARSTIVIVEQMDLRAFHFIQLMTTRFLPWWFVKGNITPEIVNLLTALRSTDPDPYTKIMDEFAERYDFRSEKIKQLMGSFEENFHRMELERIDSDKDHAMREIENLNNRFQDQYQRLERCETMRLGLLAKIDQVRDGGGDSEIMEYFMRAKNIDIVNVNGSSISFIVKDYIKNYDPEMFESAYNNDRSFLWRDTERGRNYTTELTKDDMDLLLHAIFVKEEIKVKVCTIFNVDFAAGSFRGTQHYNYPADCKNYIPNQHIDQFNCFGGNESIVRAAIMEHDYVGALSALVAVNANMSMNDAVVGTKFMAKIYGDQCKYLTLPDGTDVNAKKAVEYLKERGDK